MGWKPKEKQLTPEEAIEAARKELAPYWQGSAPLLAGVRAEGGRVTVHPLDKSIEAKAWLLLMADLTTFAGEAVLQYAREWSRRFSVHELGFILIVRPFGRALENAKSLEPFLKRSSITFPVVIDHDGLLMEAFGAQDGLPKLVLMHQRKVVLDQSGLKGLQAAEIELQKFLRLLDPGLPLSPPFEPLEARPLDVSRLELNLATIKTAGVTLQGKWNVEADRISTSDVAASLSFKSPAARVSFLAQSVLRTEDPSRLRVELGGQPVFDQAGGPDLISADDGSTEARVNEPQLYHVLMDLPATQRGITLRFPDVDRLPIAIYGFRFGL